MLLGARVETAPEQLTTGKLHYGQLIATRIPDHLRGMGGTHTEATAFNESSKSSWNRGWQGSSLNRI